MPRASISLRPVSEWARYPLRRLKMARARRAAWRRLFSTPESEAVRNLSAQDREDANRAAHLILASHRAYFSEFNTITAEAQDTFERRDWARAARNAERRVGLYRAAVDRTWQLLEQQFGPRLADARFWLGARRLFLEQIFDDYDADLALTFFYSTMRIAFDAQDNPVEYDDDGLSERSHVWGPQLVWRAYPGSPKRLLRSVLLVLESAGFRAPFENVRRDAALVSERLLRDWTAQAGTGPSRRLQMLRPVFFRDQEAYLVGKLRSADAELPVVFALRHEAAGITVDAVLTGKEDMRNILFVSTRSTFHVPAPGYRQILRFLDTLAPERGHPAMCAVLGFTHPARVALNQRLRRHLAETGERFAVVPGRTGMAMVVFAPPSFPYVFKVVRDFSSKPGWMGRHHIMEIYRWVHEMNRGRLMLDAWIYRNLHFRRDAFDPQILEELLTSAPGSVRHDGDTVVLKHVYAQRRVTPLSTFFDQTPDRSLRERVIDSLGGFIKDLARMGFFMGDHYGLPFNTGLTHAFNVALFDFDDLGPVSRYRFRETPPAADEQTELLWNTETDGAWFAVNENDVLVDEWETFLGVPADLRDYFRRSHADLFTTAYWTEVQRRVAAGELHYVVPYPAERRLARND